MSAISLTLNSEIQNQVISDPSSGSDPADKSAKKITKLSILLQESVASPPAIRAVVEQLRAVPSSPTRTSSPSSISSSFSNSPTPSSPSSRSSSPSPTPVTPITPVTPSSTPIKGAEKRREVIFAKQPSTTNKATSSPTKKSGSLKTKQAASSAQKSQISEGLAKLIKKGNETISFDSDKGPKVLKMLKEFGFSPVNTTGSHISMKIDGNGPLVVFPNHASIALGTLNSVLAQARTAIAAAKKTIA